MHKKKIDVKTKEAYSKRYKGRFLDGKLYRVFIISLRQ